MFLPLWEELPIQVENIEIRKEYAVPDFVIEILLFSFNKDWTTTPWKSTKYLVDAKWKKRKAEIRFLSDFVTFISRQYPWENYEAIVSLPSYVVNSMPDWALKSCLEYNLADIQIPSRSWYSEWRYKFDFGRSLQLRRCIITVLIIICLMQTYHHYSVINIFSLNFYHLTLSWS